MDNSARNLEVNQVQVYGANNQLLYKLMSAPVVYVRQDPKCSLCPQTYKVYIHTAVIGDGNFEVLKDPLFSVIDEACCLFCESCTTLNFYSVLDNTIQYNVSYKKCCDECCKCKETKCCDCNCTAYGPSLFGSYGANQDSRFGRFTQRFCGNCCCCSYLNSDEYEFFGKMDESRFVVKVDCCQSFSCCMHLYPLYYHILNGDQLIGNVIRSPRGCCGTYTYEIQFPAGLTLEDRLLLVAFCCKRP